MIAIGIMVIFGSTFFRAIPSIDWTLSAAIAFSAFGLVVVGLLFTLL